MCGPAVFLFGVFLCEYNCLVYMVGVVVMCVFMCFLCFTCVAHRCGLHYLCCVCFLWFCCFFLLFFVCCAVFLSVPYATRVPIFRVLKWSPFVVYLSVCVCLFVFFLAAYIVHVLGCGVVVCLSVVVSLLLCLRFVYVAWLVLCVCVC